MIILKDKDKLTSYRKLIESKMEQFKDVERDHKTKPHSKQVDWFFKYILMLMQLVIYSCCNMIHLGIVCGGKVGSERASKARMCGMA